MRKEDFFEGNPLSRSIELDFGISHRDTRTIRELYYLNKYMELVDEMSDQKAFTRSYITDLFEEGPVTVSEKTIRKVINILVKRGLLRVLKFEGKARATFGVNVYYAGNATKTDIEATLRIYVAYDDLRYAKQVQRQKSFDEIKENTYVARMAGYEANQDADRDIRRLQIESVICEHGYMPKECTKNTKCKNFKHRRRRSAK